MNNLTALPYEDIYLIVSDAETSRCDMYYNPDTKEILHAQEVNSRIFLDLMEREMWQAIEYQSADKFPGVPLFKIPWGEDVEKLADEYLRKNAPWIQEKNYSDAIIDFTFGYNAHTSTHRWSDEDIKRAISIGIAIGHQCDASEFEDEERKALDKLKLPLSYTVTLGETLDGIQLIDKYEKI